MAERTVPPPMSSPADAAWVERYLRHLGIVAEAPSLPALERLIRAHLLTLPFENLTSLLRRGAAPDGPVPPPDPDRLLANWEARRGGGVCYELAGMFGRLLRALGYDARQILGQISFPGGHQAVLVTIDGARYLVDVGSGSPIFQAIPLDRETELTRGVLRYRFRPGENAGIWVQDRFIDGAWKPHCRYTLRPPRDDEQDAAYQRHHTPSESWVVDAIRMVGVRENGAISVLNEDVTIFAEDGKRSERVTTEAEYRRLVGLLGIPNAPIAEAIRVRDRLARLVIPAP